MLVCASLLAACGDGGEPPPPSQTTLAIYVTDGPGGAYLPAKVVLVAEDGKPLHIGSLDMYSGTLQDRGYCEMAHGVVGTYDGLMLVDGTGEIPVGRDDCSPSPAVPFGRYRLQVLRGIEYEIFEMPIELSPSLGQIVVVVPLERAWAPPEDVVAADLHVHAETSYDSTMPPWVRVGSELVTGIQVIGATDHNQNNDFDVVIDDMGLRGQIASVPGNEISVDLMHANIFPALVEPGKPRNGAASFDELAGLSAATLFQNLHALPGSPLVQMNHPRLRFAAYFDAVGWNGESWPPPMPYDFDILEVLNGASALNIEDDRRIERSLADLYTFLEHGKLLAATGNSDTHHLNSILAGVPRNYVYLRDGRFDPFDVGGFVDALRARRILATTGPWLEVHAGGADAGTGEMVVPEDGEVQLQISLRQARFVKTTRLRVLVGKQVRVEIPVPPGRAFTWVGNIAIDEHGPDTFIAVDAIGDEPLPVSLTGDFIQRSVSTGVPPVAFINPILVDVDGNGRWDVAQSPAAVPDLLPPPRGNRHKPLDCMPPAPPPEP